VSKPKYSSYKELYDDVVRQAVEECVLCGECVSNCRMFPLNPALKDKDPTEIAEKMIDFLKDGGSSEEVYTMAFGCAGCGYCNDFCPQGIDVLRMVEATKIELLKHGEKPPEAINFVLPRQRINIFEILAALQIKPSERRWLRRIPPQPKKSENVVFLGCSPPALPHNTFAFLDILERMGLDFVTLSGGELCCGTAFCPTGGMVEESEEYARELVTALKEAFSPKRLIFDCTGCYRQFGEYFPEFLYDDMDFELKFYTQFLSENLDKINFIKPVEKTVTLHDSCVLARRFKDTESPRKILRAIPGLKLVEMEHNSGETLCCGGLANMTNPPLGQKLGHTLVEEAEKTGVDYLVDVCPFCQSAIYPHLKGYSFGLRDIATLMNESMGGREYENKLEKYWRCESVDEIIEKSKENFEANGYTEEEMRQVLPLLFGFSGP
jgi:heterodisulfide reductase subunit D